MGSRLAGEGDKSGASNAFVYKKMTGRGWEEHVNNMEAACEIEKVLKLQVNAD